MAFIFNNKLKNVPDFNGLGDLEHNLYGFGSGGRRVAFLSKVRECMPDNIAVVVRLAKKISVISVRYEIVRIFIEKFGIKSIATVRELISVLVPIDAIKDTETAELLKYIMDSSKEVLIVPEDADIDELKKLVEYLNQLSSGIEACTKVEIPVEIIRFAEDLVDEVIKHVRKKHDLMDEFMDLFITLPVRCDFMVVVSEIENVTAGMLIKMLKNTIMISGAYRHLEIVHATRVALLAAAKRVSVENEEVFSFEELKVLAGSIYDVKGDGKTTSEIEHSVIEAGLVLATDVSMAVELANSFGTQTGSHVFISTFVAERSQLTEDELIDLAGTVHSDKRFGLLAKETLRVIKEELKLEADIEEIFKKNHKKVGLGMSLAGVVIIGSDGNPTELPDGLLGPLSEIFFGEMLAGEVTEVASGPCKCVRCQLNEINDPAEKEAIEAEYVKKKAEWLKKGLARSGENGLIVRDDEATKIICEDLELSETLRQIMSTWLINPSVKRNKIDDADDLRERLENFFQEGRLHEVGFPSPFGVKGLKEVTESPVSNSIDPDILAVLKEYAAKMEKIPEKGGKLNKFLSTN